MVVSNIQGLQNRPQYTMILIVRSPKRDPQYVETATDELALATGPPRYLAAVVLIGIFAGLRLYCYLILYWANCVEDVTLWKDESQGLCSPINSWNGRMFEGLKPNVDVQQLLSKAGRVHRWVRRYVREDSAGSLVA